MKRHHDQDNSYKGQHLIGTDLQVQRFSPLILWQEAWQHPGRKYYLFLVEVLSVFGGSIICFRGKNIESSTKLYYTIFKSLPEVAK